MDRQEALDRVKEIADVADDPDAAHGFEDILYYDFIKVVSESDCKLAEVAKVVLGIADLDFPRWTS